MQTDPQQPYKSPTQQTDQYSAKHSGQPAIRAPKHEVLEEHRSPDAETAGIGGAAIGAVQICDHPPGKTAESKAADTAVVGGAIGASESAKEADLGDKVRDNKEVPAHDQGAKVPRQPGDEELTKNRGVENRTGDVGKVIGDRRSDEDIKHTHQAGAHTGGYDVGDYHPAKLHPLRVGENTSQAEAQPDTPISPASAPPASVTDSSKERRVSFLDKVRGEARIFAGKMTGKEDKVEEGKRMMHGKV